MVTRANGYIVIAMCFYPRGLKKELRDEYLSSLAPDKALFKDWQEFAKRYGHEAAFRHANYEDRFQLSERAFVELERLTVLSRQKDVYLVCQCSEGERCHREMLLLAAKKAFGAEIAPVSQEYPRFLARLQPRGPSGKPVLTPPKG